MVSCPHLLQRYEGLLVSNILLVVGSQRARQGAGGCNGVHLSHSDLNLDGRHHLDIDSTYISFASL